MKHLSSFRLSYLITIAGAALTCHAQIHTPLADPIPATIPDSPVTIQLKQVASGMVQPVWGTFAPDDNDHLYVVDQTGKAWVVDVSNDGKPADKKLFLDVSSRLVTLGLFGINYDERGFLGLAFHPRFEKNGLFYTFTSEPVKGPADFTTLSPGTAPNCQTVILEWRVMNPDRDEESPIVDLSSVREVMRIDKPQFNHNGGTLVFGPDGMLYIGLGDGGAANDRGTGHVAGGNAQSLAAGNVLGKILRIDPLGRNSANGKYGIPADNPFVGTGHGAPEIWAYGLRNPFRMSFDFRTGMLYVGDVGQNNIEEVDVVQKGGNYGWPVKEGTFLFDVSATNMGFVFADSPGTPAGLVDPIAEYDHADGAPPVPNTRVAIIGGFVYRGHEADALRGQYIFGDYSGPVGTPVNGHIYRLAGKDNHIENLKVDGRTQLGLAVLGFGQDSDGEVYLMASETGVVKGTTGQVLKITTSSKKKDD